MSVSHLSQNSNLFTESKLSENPTQLGSLLDTIGSFVSSAENLRDFQAHGLKKGEGMESGRIDRFESDTLAIIHASLRDQKLDAAAAQAARVAGVNAVELLLQWARIWYDISLKSKYYQCLDQVEQDGQTKRLSDLQNEIFDNMQEEHFDKTIWAISGGNGRINANLLGNEEVARTKNAVDRRPAFTTRAEGL